MVHTIELYMNLTEKESKVIKYDFQIGNSKFYNFENFINTEGVMMTLKNECDGNKGIDRIYIFVDCIKLLARAEIVEDDVIIIQSKINNLLYSVLRINKSLYLSRIDYRFDYLVADKHERELLFINYNKYLEKTSYMKKKWMFLISLVKNLTQLLVLDMIIQVRHLIYMIKLKREKLEGGR